MNQKELEAIFTEATLETIFPAERSDQFFDALFGDPTEGAYDIQLLFRGPGPASNELTFELHLKQRPGRCLACNLTYGLPEVFSRHPIINLPGVANAIAQAVGKTSASWRLGATDSVSRALHVIQLTVTLGQ